MCLEQIKYYKVVCKCGHVGRKHYIPVQFAVMAEDGKEAAKKARNFPRVKHQHKNAILDVVKLDYEEYLELLELNRNDSYLNCHSKQEQNRLCDLSDRIKDDLDNNIKKIDKKTRVSRVRYIKKKFNLIEKSYWEETKECL